MISKVIIPEGPIFEVQNCKVLTKFSVVFNHYYLQNMKKLLLVGLFIMTGVLLFGQSYKKLHFKAIVADTHNDILTTAFDKHVSFDRHLKGKTQTDLDRLAEGGVDIQVFSIWCDGTYGMGKGFVRANQQ